MTIVDILQRINGGVEEKKKKNPLQRSFGTP